MPALCLTFSILLVYLQDKECNLLYVQRTPDICKFLEMEVPKNNAEEKKSASTTNANDKKDSAGTQQTPTDAQHPAERTGSIGGRFFLNGTKFKRKIVQCIINIFHFLL